MGDKDPPPFGYTFSGFFDGDSAPFDNSQSLLTDTESQSIADFFSNTDPFTLSDSHAFPSTADTKHGYSDFNDWHNFVTPAIVHGVSSTIPDQSHLHNTFFNEPTFAQPSVPSIPSHHLPNTRDDLQAAETLFNNSQSSYTAGRSQSFNGVPSSSRTTNPNGSIQLGPGGRPMVVTQHGLLNEQLASLLPNHDQNGTVDAQLAAQWAATNLEQLRETQFGAMLRKPNLKRSYTFGTDDSFNNPTGFAGPPGPDSNEDFSRHIARAFRQSQPDLPTVGSNGNNVNPRGHGHARSAAHDDPSDEEQSEEASSEDDEDDRPAKKRRKSKVAKDTPRKQARNGKNRKGSAVDEKKKRPSSAQKLQRENLTEEQKRSNHILSEQKRRNLIKRGFDDLHDLVPEIRNGGLSKSSVLMEAGNFLEKIIQDNIAFSRIAGG